MVEGKMMKVGTKLLRISTFSPINFQTRPNSLRTNVRASSSPAECFSEKDLDFSQSRRKVFRYFESFKDIYSSIKIVSKITEEEIVSSFEYSIQFSRKMRGKKEKNRDIVQLYTPDHS